MESTGRYITDEKEVDELMLQHLLQDSIPIQCFVRFFNVQLQQSTCIFDEMSWQNRGLLIFDEYGYVSYILGYETV